MYANADIEITGQAASWGVFAGGLVQLGILMWGAWRQGFLLKLRLPRLTPSMKRLFLLGAPGFISAGAVQINLIIGTNIASREPGAVSWLMNADQLYQLPLAVVGIALAVVLLPLLSERVKAGDEKGAARALNRSLELSALLTIPAAAAFVIMGEPICDALFRGIAGDALSVFGVKRSAFTPNDVAMTAAALAVFGCGLPAFVWQKIFLPAYFAREDTRTPMNYALISIAINTVVALALFPFIGFIAVAVATVLAAWAQVILLAQKLYRQKLFSPGGRLASRFLRILIATVGMVAMLIWGLSYIEEAARLVWNREWIATVLLAGAGIIIYGVFAYALGAARLADYKRPPSGA
jgi:putative peptidoglycan lipid II flippase